MCFLFFLHFQRFFGWNHNFIESQQSMQNLNTHTKNQKQKKKQTLFVSTPVLTAIVKMSVFVFGGGGLGNSNFSQSLRHKLSLEMTTCCLSSNAFKNGVLMLRNIGSPLSNAYRNPIFERLYFCVLFHLLSFVLKVLNPYFCSVFVDEQPLLFRTPQTRAAGYIRVRAI